MVDFRALTMRSLSVILLLLLALSARAQTNFATATVQWSFVDPVTGTPARGREVRITPLSSWLAGQALTDVYTRKFPTTATGSLIISNVITPGSYRVELFDQSSKVATTAITNTFPLTNGFLLANAWTSAPTNSPTASVAYSMAAADARFLKVSDLGNITVASDWSGTAKFLLAAASSGEYQMLSATYDANGMPTNGVILWPDSTYGTFSATVNPTWFALDGFVLTYTNTGKTITQPTVSRDAFGNVTNVPALVITP